MLFAIVCLAISVEVSIDLWRYAKTAKDRQHAAVYSAVTGIITVFSLFMWGYLI